VSTFFIGKNETEMDVALDPDMLMKVHPDYYGPRFQAIADLRKLDDGTLHKGNEFRRVASFVNVPLFNKARQLFDPEFMKDRKRFYAFLDRNRQYCTYDRRWPGGEQPTVRTPEPVNLAELGVDYPGGPKTAEGWDAVEVDVPLAAEAS